MEQPANSFQMFAAMDIECCKPGKRRDDPETDPDPIIRGWGKERSMNSKDVDVEQRIRMIKGIAGILSCDMNQDENTRAAVEAIFEFADSIEKEFLATGAET